MRAAASSVIRGFQDRQRCLRRSDRRGRVRHRSSDDEASTHLGAVSECTWETARLGATRCPWPARHRHRLRRGPAPDNPSATERESVISARHPLWRTALWRPRITKEGWRRFAEHQPQPPERLAAADLDRLTAAHRGDYDDARKDYHADLPMVNTPVIQKVIATSRLLIQLNGTRSPPAA